MIVGNVQNVRMNLIYEDESRFALSRLRLDAEDEKIYDLAISINSIQDRKINKVIKRTITELMEI